MNSPITEPLPLSRYRTATTSDREKTAATTQTTILAPGTRIDEFHIVEGPIGEPTGEGEVYRCRRAGDPDREYALKLYHPEIEVSEAVLRNIMQIPHPNILPLISVSRWNKRTYDVGALCEGGPLLFSGPLKEPTVRGLVSEVVEGMRHLHRNGILHGDLKPTNLLFTYPEMIGVVISDFGNSRFVPGTSARPSRITPAFAAPEIWENTEISEKTDYYALGMIVLNWVWGFSPFRGKDVEMMRRKHCRTDGEVLPLPFGLNKSLVQLIWGLTRRTVNLRWGYQQVSQWLANEPVFLDDGAPDRIVPGEDRTIPPFPRNKAVRSLGDLVTYLENEEHAIACRYVYQETTVLDWLRNFDSDSLLQKVRLAIKTWRGSPEDFPDVRHDKNRLGIFVLRCLLAPEIPLRIGYRSVSTIDELANLLEEMSTAESSILKKLWKNGSLEKWVELTQREKPESADHAREILPILSRLAPYSVTTESDAAGFFALRCAVLRFCHSRIVPFEFRGNLAENPARLAEVIDCDSRTWEEKSRTIDFDAIRTWLWAIGFFSGSSPRHENFEEIITSRTFSPEVKLEAILCILDPRMPRPEITWTLSETLPLTLLPETTHSVKVSVKNPGRGWLGGVAAIRTENPENIRLSETHSAIPIINGAEFEIVFSSGFLSPEEQRVGTLMLNHYYKTEAIPLGFEVGIPRQAILGKAVIAGMVGASAGFLGFQHPLFPLIFSIILFTGYLGLSPIFPRRYELWRYPLLIIPIGLSYYLLYLGYFGR
jgi:hypothetical protein